MVMDKYSNLFICIFLTVCAVCLSVDKREEEKRGKFQFLWISDVFFLDGFAENVFQIFGFIPIKGDLVFDIIDDHNF